MFLVRVDSNIVWRKKFSVSLSMISPKSSTSSISWSLRIPIYRSTPAMWCSTLFCSLCSFSINVFDAPANNGAPYDMADLIICKYSTTFVFLGSLDLVLIMLYILWYAAPPFCISCFTCSCILRRLSNMNPRYLIFVPLLLLYCLFLEGWWLIYSFVV